MVMVSAHLRDERGREKLKVVVKDWNETEECKYTNPPSSTACRIDHFKFICHLEWHIMFPQHTTNLHDPSIVTAELVTELEDIELGGPGDIDLNCCKIKKHLYIDVKKLEAYLCYVHATCTVKESLKFHI